MLIMREIRAIVEKVDQKSKERTCETGVLLFFEPGEASYSPVGSNNSILIPIEEIPELWKVNEIKEIKVGSEKGLYRLRHVEFVNWKV